MKLSRRERIRLKLNELYLPRYDVLCESLNENWQPYSGYRSIEDQDKIFARGRTEAGARVTNAMGGQSAHNYGMATDWVWFDPVTFLPVWESGRWDEYRDAVHVAGLKWGGDFNDRPHNQLKIGMSYKRLNEIRLERGLEFTMSMLKDVVGAAREV